MLGYDLPPFVTGYTIRSRIDGIDGIENPLLQLMTWHTAMRLRVSFHCRTDGIHFAGDDGITRNEILDLTDLVTTACSSYVELEKTGFQDRMAFFGRHCLSSEKYERSVFMASLNLDFTVPSGMLNSSEISDWV